MNRRRDGEKVSLQELAEELGVKYDTLRRWKSADKWDEMKPPPKRARGGQPKNKKTPWATPAAHRPGNQNARTHGGYAAVFFDQLTDDELLIMDKTPKFAVKALREELDF